MAFIRKVVTKSGATAVQIAFKESGRVVKLEHLGSAHTKDELDQLIQIGKQRLLGPQTSLFPELPPPLTIKIKESYSKLLWRELRGQYRSLGFDQLKDEIFAALCVARLVEPTSKLDSLRVLADLGIQGIDKNELYRCLQTINTKDYRQIIGHLCLSRSTQSGLSLLLYDVTTLYFEAGKEDDYRKSGLSKERRLEPQIVIGLLVDQAGFPLSLQSFAGNTAETKTIIPVLEAYRQEHRLPKMTVVADAAMMNLTNLHDLEVNGYTYIVASRLTKIPYAISEFQKEGQLTDQQIMVDKRESFRIIYQYREKRAALDLRNIKKQLTKALRIVSGKAPAHHSKFVTVKTKTKSLNQKLLAKAYALAGIKGYVTNLNIPDTEVINYYHQLFQVEKSFRMAKSDLRARPIFHRKKEAIEAHLTIVLASLATGRTIEAKTGVSLKRFVRLLQPIRSGTVLVNGKIHPAGEVIPPNLKVILQKLHSGH